VTRAQRASELPDRGRRIPRRLPDVLLVVVLAAQGARALTYGRDGWFGVDALHYFAQRGTLPGASTGLLEPYAGHWISGLLVVYRGLFELFGLRSYLPFLTVAVGAHLLIVLLSYLILLRLGVGRWVALACVTVLATFGAGSEAFLLDSPLALTGAVALGLYALWTLLRHEFARPALIRSAIALLVGVMFSITGVVMAAVTAAVVIVARGWRAAVVLVAPAAVAFTVWFAFYGRTTDRVQASGEQLYEIPNLAWSLVTAPLGNVFLVPAAGVTLTLAVIAGLFLAGRSDTGGTRTAVAWAGLLGACAQAGLSALATAQLPAEAVLVGRYQYVVLVLILPAVALTLDLVARLGASGRSPALLPSIFVTVVLASLVVGGLRGQWKTHQFVAAESELFREMFAGTFAATAAGETVLTRDLAGHYLRADDMATIAASGVGGELPDIYPTEQQRIEAESAFFVGVSLDPWNLPGPSDLRSGSFDRKKFGRVGCVTATAQTFTPVLEMTSFEGAQISVRSDGGAVTGRLVRDGVSSQPRRWVLDAERPTYIATTAELATLELTFESGGQYVICRA